LIELSDPIVTRTGWEGKYSTHVTWPQWGSVRALINRRCSKLQKSRRPPDAVTSTACSSENDERNYEGLRNSKALMNTRPESYGGDGTIFLVKRDHHLVEAYVVNDLTTC
jgi:hypothetical protein